jgi:hypothetical protein
MAIARKSDFGKDEIRQAEQAEQSVHGIELIGKVGQAKIRKTG